MPAPPHRLTALPLSAGGGIAPAAGSLPTSLQSFRLLSPPPCPRRAGSGGGGSGSGAVFREETQGASSRQGRGSGRRTGKGTVRERVGGCGSVWERVEKGRGSGRKADEGRRREGRRGGFRERAAGRTGRGKARRRPAKDKYPLDRSDLLTGKTPRRRGRENPPRRGVGGAKTKKWLSADSPAPAGSGRRRRRPRRSRRRRRAGNTPRRRGRSRCRGWRSTRRTRAGSRRSPTS